MYILNHLLLKSRYSEEMNNEKVESVAISKDDRFIDTHSVPLDAPLSILSQLNSQYICYHLAPSLVPSSSSRSASEVLMQRSRETVLPAPTTNPNLRGDQQVRNVLLSLLSELKVGWSPCVVQSTGERFVRILSAALWYLDCHHESFRNQGIHIPSKFQGYNDYKFKVDITFSAIFCHD